MTTLLPESDQTQLLPDTCKNFDSNPGISILAIEGGMKSIDIQSSEMNSQLKELIEEEGKDDSLISISDSSCSSLSSCQKPDSADYSPISFNEVNTFSDKPHSPTIKNNNIQKEITNPSPGECDNKCKQPTILHNEGLSSYSQCSAKSELLNPQDNPLNHISLPSKYHISNQNINIGTNFSPSNTGPYYGVQLTSHFRSAQNSMMLHNTAPFAYEPVMAHSSPASSFSKGDEIYLADSSVAAANAAGRKKRKKKFPPPTKENLAKYRNEANATNDPRLQLDYAKFLLVGAKDAFSRTQDQRRVKKAQENMIMEAQKIVKKLASHSGMGKQGYAEAQFFLANCYGTGGLGLQKDPEKAFSLYIQGSKQNHPGCTYRAAVCYEVGAGTKRDKNHAMQFYRKAANLGEPSAMYKLGVILLKGFLAQPKHPREGISWLKRASQSCDEDHPHALHELAMAYEKEGIPSVIPDLNYSRELYSQAAQYGYAPSQLKLGLAYENGFLNCPIDPRRSIAWYSKAAEQGDLESQFALSGWYLTGADGILQQNDVEAYLWARKAADRGYPKAQYAVGYYTETGTGTRQNLEEAKKWYRLAASQNYRRAKQRLAELRYANTRPQQKRRHTREGNKQDSECTIM